MSFVQAVLLGLQDTPATVEIDGKTYRVAAVDASSRLLVAVDAFNASVEATQATPDDLRVGTYGRIAGAWQRQPLARGYSRAYAEVESATAVAGTNTLTFSTVAAGRVRVVTNVWARDASNVPTTIEFRAVYSAAVYRLDIIGTPATATGALFKGPVYIDADNNMTVVVTGATAGDTLQAYAVGYEFDVTL